jgi:glycine cleavage system aminomethyltransferase T
VGLGFAVAWDTEFRGKEATAGAKAAFPSTQRLVQIKLDDPEPLLYHAEPVLRDGEVVGYVRAASYGWTLGASVGLAFVTRRPSRDQGLARRRHLAGRRRRRAVRPRGLAAADVRPHVDARQSVITSLPPTRPASSRRCASAARSSG